MEETTRKSRKSSGGKPYRIYVIVALLLIIIAGGGYFGYRYWQTKQNSPEAQAAQADEEKKKILSELSQLMVLPEGDPVLFKVNDEETMRKQQAFFKDTRNDDVLLVFQASGKAIIFRPSTKMIVNVGPVNFDQNTPAKTTGDTTQNTQATSTPAKK